MTSSLGTPLDVRPLLRAEQRELRALLVSLDESAWRRPTVAPGWDVHAIAVHLLGDHLGRLSRSRDAWDGIGPQPGEPFPAFVHRVNDEWVRAGARLSPRVLLPLLEHAADEVAAHWDALDLDATGGAVTWAGPEPAPVRLDCARDYTESWVHQQQIRDAVGAPLLADPAYLGPVVRTFVLALPWTLEQHAPRVEGLAARLDVEGPSGGTWTCTRADGRWHLSPGAASDPPTATVAVDEDTFWRLCTRGVTPAHARERARCAGDRALQDATLEILAVIR
jgi:uncharacterized protein (TIGR03083 family)